MKIIDIAKQAGVSIGTVDRVLHNRGRVAETTAKRIEEIIKANDYRPNQMARNLKIGRTLKIGVLIPSLSSEYGYWQTIKRGMDEAYEELSGFPISIEYQEFNRTAKNDLFNKGMSLIEKKVDVIALPPIIKNQVGALIDKIDIPYVFFDSPFGGAKPMLQVLQNPYKAGYCAGRLMSVFNNGDGRFITVQVYAEAYNLRRRASGFRDYFKGSASEINDIICNVPDDNSFEALLDKLSSAKCDGIFITNDITGKLSSRLSKRPAYKMPIIIGFDTVEDNKAELKNGNITALISQQPKMQGLNTIRCIFDCMMLDNKQLDTEYWIPIEIFLKENIDF